MVLGMTLPTYTLLHVLISLVGIGSDWLSWPGYSQIGGSTAGPNFSNHHRGDQPDRLWFPLSIT
jgi:hypothetical protein